MSTTTILTRGDLIDKLSEGDDFIQVQFSYLDLTGINMKQATFINCRFDDCVLVNTDFTECDLGSTVFRNCVMRGTRLCYAEIDKALFIFSDDVIDAGFDRRGFRFVGVRRNHVAESGDGQEGAELPGGAAFTAFAEREEAKALARDQREEKDDDWMIKAGCRWFTEHEAIEHWEDKQNSDAIARVRLIQAGGELGPYS
jgi:hypothetical protein